MHHQILYLSRLVEGCSFDVFPAICKAARAHNAERALRGVLLFDGFRFCQLIEGPAEAIRALMDRIAQDARHEQVQILLDRPVAPREAVSRSAGGWRSGYCEHDEFDRFEGPQGLVGEAALAAFDAMLARADLSP